MSHVYSTLPTYLAMSQSLQGNISTYALYREQHFFAGLFLIPITSLIILPTLQQPYNEAHARTCKAMYSTQVDVRGTDPLECVIPLASKDLVVNWLKNQDLEKLSNLKPADLLVLDLPEVKFIILKGQHRYEAYHLALEEEGLLPKDAPHPECLGVRLFYSGVYRCHATFI
jgi:hypothetical protein